MTKKYNDRAMSTEDASKEVVLERGRAFFFPNKGNQPITITANSREEAEEKLKAFNNKENE